MASLTTPQNDIYRRLQALGWELKRIEFKGGQYVAKGSNDEAGLEVERTGKTPEQALLGVFTYAQRAAEIRRFAALRKLGAWQADFTSQKEDIARAYRALPAFDATAIDAWTSLAAESKAQADAVRKQIDVTYLDDPEPYESAREMSDDVKLKQKLTVSRFGLDHPLWTPEQVLDFRTVHDAVGHVQSGGDFTWRGENLAFSTHAPLVSPLAQEALFVEVLGRAAYLDNFRGVGPHKVALMSEFLRPAQAAEGHHVGVPHGTMAQPYVDEQAQREADEQARQRAVYDQQVLKSLPPGHFGLPTVSDGWKAKPRPAFKGSVYDWAADPGWRVAMPVARPRYVDEAIQTLHPDELHQGEWKAAEGTHCPNPKCPYVLTPEDEEQVQQTGYFSCPSCHGDFNMMEDEGWTRAGLGLTEMGHIGEQLVLNQGTIPGLGTFRPAHTGGKWPIDAVLDGVDGVTYGVEIKSNHSQAQERFKVGKAEERAGKIRYCLSQGLTPALVGVRLNFYTDQADVFFRPGLTDTWIGNKQMRHVGTFDFSALNPFKAPTPEGQAEAVEGADIPDQSLATDDDIPF